jgi:microcystin-dependent protein
MTDPFLAEIRLYAFDFPPRGWAFCDGQLLPISQATALFSLLGTTYGGDGQSNFALPDLQGRVAVGWGDAGGAVSARERGEIGGSDEVALLPSEIPFHTHTVNASGDLAEYAAPGPGSSRVLARSSPGLIYGPTGGQRAQLSGQALSVAGGDLPHNNLMPYVVMNYCIAIVGVFPPRS